jgi:hypothetical protein
LGVVEYPSDLQSGALSSSSLGVLFKPNRDNQGNSLSLCFTGKLSLARVWACTWSGCAGHISNRICTSDTQQDQFHYQISKPWINKQANHLTRLWVASDQHHWPVKQGKFHQQLASLGSGCWAHDQRVMHLKHNTLIEFESHQREIQVYHLP